MIRLHTNLGDIDIALDDKNAPRTVKNFTQYVEEKFYYGTIFHRVIDGFMVQGGGFTQEMQQKPTHEPIQNEANNGLKNERYTVAMARTNDPHSATAQFFINVSDNYFLDFTSDSPAGWGYTVFGKVVAGQEVVDKIKSLQTGSHGIYQDVPKEAAVIIRAEKIN